MPIERQYKGVRPLVDSRAVALERREMNYFNTKYLMNFAQQTADAISSVLNMQVTVVDSDVRRVAGTGCFSLTLDKILSPNYVFYGVIRTGERWKKLLFWFL